MQHAVLKRDHHFIKFAEQRHEFGNTEFLRVNANRAAGDAVVAGSLVRLTDKVHLEGGRILLFLFRRVPLVIFHDALFIFRLALVGVQVSPAEVPFDVVKRTPHHLLHRLRGNFLFTCHIRRNKGKGEQLVVCHRVIVTDVVCFLDKLTIDLFALFHNVGGIFPAVLLCQNLFHRAFERPEIKTVVFHITCPPVIYLQA